MTSIKVGLDALGLQDSHHLKCALINCEDPLKAISDFQEENSILLPTLKPALPLLDLHSVKRLDFHQSVADELKERLTKRIEELTESKTQDDIKKLEELLDKSFPVINVPRITNLVLLIMKNLSKINPVYLNYIQENDVYYQVAPIEVKRQIWMQNEELFYKELNPLFDKCLQYFDEQLFNVEVANKVNSSSNKIHSSEKILDQNQFNVLKFKRHSTHINDIVKMIGNNGKLYFNAVNYSLRLFLNTKNWNYASIRSLLLIKLHDVDVVDLNSSENIYKFTWTLNACIKERKIDAKRAKELEAIVDSKKFDKILSDVVFILADCFAIDTLAYTILNLLFTKCVQNESLPRDCSEIVFILRLLSLGLQSWDILSLGQIKKEPKMDVNIVLTYLSSLAYFMADYQERIFEESLNTISHEFGNSTLQSHTESNHNNSSEYFLSNEIKTNQEKNLKNKIQDTKITQEKLESLEFIKKYNDNNNTCCVLTLYFILECVELNDWNNIKLFLPIIKYPDNSIHFEKWFLSQFIWSLCDRIEYLKIDWIFKLVFEFLVKNLKSDYTYELSYKLIENFIQYNEASTNIFSNLLEEIRPKKTNSSNIQMQFSRLKSKVDNNNEITK